MKVVFVTTWNTACGIATYSANLIKQLRAQGLDVEVFSSTNSYTELTKLAKMGDFDIVHFQHEFGIMPEVSAFMSLLGKLRSRGKQIVITMHTEDDPFNIMIDGVVDAVVLHNDDKGLNKMNMFSRFLKIPHGIPEISFPESKAFYRKKYGIPENAFVIGTCGFLAKQSISNMVAALIPFMKEHTEVFMNLVTSAHRADKDGAGAKAIKDAIMILARNNGFEDRVFVGTEFTPTQEFRERINTLDLGFSFANPAIKSNSGAAADLAACGIPVVANDAPHFSHIKDFISVTKEHTVYGVAMLVAEIYGKIKADPKFMEQISVRAKKVTESLGYSKVAKKHIELYDDLFKNKGVVRESYQIPTLDKTKPIILSVPNELWQILAIWPKIYGYVSKGFKVAIAAQSEGLTDLTTFQFMLGGIDKIYFDNVNMVKDPYLLKTVSKNVAQRSFVDLEYWMRRGYTYESLFPDAGIDFAYPIHLGAFAEKRALEYCEDVTHIISLTPQILPRLKEILMDIPPHKTILVMTAPLNAHLLDSVKSVFAVYPGTVKYAVEDLRTRWAMCKNISKMYSVFDDVGVFSALEGHNTVYSAWYFTDDPWQARLLQAFKVNSNCIKMTVYELNKEITLA